MFVRSRWGFNMHPIHCCNLNQFFSKISKLQALFWTRDYEEFKENNTSKSRSHRTSNASFKIGVEIIRLYKWFFSVQLAVSLVSSWQSKVVHWAHIHWLRPSDSKRSGHSSHYSLGLELHFLDDGFTIIFSFLSFILNGKS